MPEFSRLKIERRDAVMLITLHRPRRGNALDVTLSQELLQAFRSAREDETVRAVVLAGAGPLFCVGADLAAFADLESPRAIYDVIVSTFTPLLEEMAEMEKPLIAAVQGAAAGAGMSLALACDLRVMAENASLIMAFSNLGLVPDTGISWLLVRHIGYSRAFELAAEAKPLPAARCLEWGLANRLAPAESVLDEALDWAEQLANRPTLALGWTKHALHFALLHDLAGTIKYEARLQMKALATQDHQEGLQAFMEKRSPRFQGR
jgi:2-(1,2-epoxy-1,2-dihydrophenyl)acetyl-CoA isomerase